jgi:hypothetical protein
MRSDLIKIIFMLRRLDVVSREIEFIAWRQLEP